MIPSPLGYSAGEVKFSLPQRRSWTSSAGPLPPNNDQFRSSKGSRGEGVRLGIPEVTMPQGRVTASPRSLPEGPAQTCQNRPAPGPWSSPVPEAWGGGGRGGVFPLRSSARTRASVPCPPSQKAPGPALCRIRGTVLRFGVLGVKPPCILARRKREPSGQTRKTPSGGGEEKRGLRAGPSRHLHGALERTAPRCGGGTRTTRQARVAQERRRASSGPAPPPDLAAQTWPQGMVCACRLGFSISPSVLQPTHVNL